MGQACTELCSRDRDLKTGELSNGLARYKTVWGIIEEITFAGLHRTRSCVPREHDARAGCKRSHTEPPGEVWLVLSEGSFLGLGKGSFKFGISVLSYRATPALCCPRTVASERTRRRRSKLSAQK
jgi:hypothetical protein